MQKDKPFFSIITCTLNSDKFLSKNLESVWGQTFKNYEHIFVDGGSEDSTKKILSKYENRFDSKVRITSDLKKGVSNAFNRGIKEAKGEYLLFLNSDDFFYDVLVLHDAHEFILKNQYPDWIYGKINVVEEDGMKVGVFPLRKIFQSANSYLLKFVNFIPHQSVFMKKGVFRRFGNFDSDLILKMDADLFLRVSTKTNWIFFDRIISNYTIRKGSLSSSFKNKDLGLATLERVQSKHLSKMEMFFAKIVNRLISIVNKTYR